MHRKNTSGDGLDADASGEERPALSAREVEVLELIVQGYSAKQTADKLSLSHRTVERHMDNARSKLGARNRPHLVRKAIASGQIRIGTDS